MKPDRLKHPCNSYDDEPRTMARSSWKPEAERAALEDALHPAEVRLIECDAGKCQHEGCESRVVELGPGLFMMPGVRSVFSERKPR